MTRGLQKEQARARAQAREEGKQGGKSHLKAQQTACNLTCPICRVRRRAPVTPGTSAFLSWLIDPTHCVRLAIARRADTDQQPQGHGAALPVEAPERAAAAGVVVLTQRR